MRRHCQRIRYDLALQGWSSDLPRFHRAKSERRCKISRPQSISAIIRSVYEFILRRSATKKRRHKDCASCDQGLSSGGEVAFTFSEGLAWGYTSNLSTSCGCAANVAAVVSA